jgi:hypothetical protein
MHHQVLSSFLWSVADLLRGDYKQSDYGRGHPATPWCARSMTRRRGPVARIFRNEDFGYTTITGVGSVQQMEPGMSAALVGWSAQRATGMFHESLMLVVLNRPARLRTARASIVASTPTATNRAPMLM